jgi:hypothetical protein
MWSQGMMFGIEMQTWGAAALGEIDQIGQKLKGHEGDNEKWWQEWTAMAKRIEGFAEAQDESRASPHCRELLPARGDLLFLRRALHRAVRAQMGHVSELSPVFPRRRCAALSGDRAHRSAVRRHERCRRGS